MLRSHPACLLVTRALPVIVACGIILPSTHVSICAATLAERLEKAKVIREFKTGGAHVWQLAVAKDIVAFVLWRNDSSAVEAFDPTGALRFRFALPDSTEGPRLCGVDLSEDGATVIVTECGDEYFEHRVFDVAGKLCFALGTAAYLVPSPQGQYFSKQYNEITAALLSIYDRQGKEVRKLEGMLSGWNCVFADDEHLFIADPDSAWIVDVQTGATQASALGLGGYRRVPTIRMSRSDSVAAVCNYNTIVMLSTTDLTELWRDSSDMDLYTLAIDEGADVLAMQFADWRAGYGFFRLVSLRNGQRLCESERIPSLSSSARHTADITWFYGGVLSQWGPPNSSFSVFTGDEQHWTLFLQWDGEAQSLSKPAKIPGIYRVMEEQAGTQRYVRVDSAMGRAQLVEIPGR
ncbi:MAG: hypothetical protein AB1792_03900 [Candidatus Zixiibacteriota bacterium]